MDEIAPSGVPASEAVVHSLTILLRGLGFEDSKRIAPLVRRLATDLAPDVDPDAARVAAEQRLGAWFRQALGLMDCPDEQAAVLARTAILYADAARRWPDHILAEDNPPAEMATALRRAVPVAVPAAEPCAMLAQSLEPVTPFSAVARLRGRPALLPAVR